MTISMKDRFRGALLGLAAGDCVGSSVEFRPPGTFAPITDMIGGGPFSLKPGQFTDDTSLGLCLAASLVECRGFEARDQMSRYVRWWREGYMSSTGRCFDIGTTSAEALRTFERTGNPFAGSNRSPQDGQRLPHAPGPGADVLREQPRRSNRAFRRKLPNDAQCPNRRGCLPLLRLPTGGRIVRCGQGDLAFAAILPGEGLLGNPSRVECSLASCACLPNLSRRARGVNERLPVQGADVHVISILFAAVGTAFHCLRQACESSKLRRSRKSRLRISIS